MYQNTINSLLSTGTKVAVGAQAIDALKESNAQKEESLRNDILNVDMEDEQLKYSIDKQNEEIDAIRSNDFPDPNELSITPKGLIDLETVHPDQVGAARSLNELAMKQKMLITQREQLKNRRIGLEKSLSDTQQPLYKRLIGGKK